MDIAFFIAFIFVLLARRNAVYHKDLLFKKYINLENKKTRLFIPKRSKVYKTAGACDGDKCKMNILPLILIAIAAVGFIVILATEIIYAKSIGQVGFFNTTDAVFKYLFWFIAMLCLAVVTLLVNTFKVFGTKTIKQKIGVAIRVILTLAFLGGFCFAAYTLFTI